MLSLTVEEPLPLLNQKGTREGRDNQNLEEEEHVEQTSSRGLDQLKDRVSQR